MESEGNREMALRWLQEVSSDGTDRSAFDRIVAPDCVIHGGFKGLPAGPEGSRQSHINATGFVEFR
jgi:hypothetical protein